MQSTILKRLAFIKLLHQQGVYQSQMHEPANSIALLMFHDSIELFLQLCTETLDISKQDQTFMGYWKAINSHKEDKQVTQEGPMRQLNKARVSLKHYGAFPSKLDMESYRASTLLFFQVNTPTFFNIDYNEIDLSDLVANKKTRRRLKAAKMHFKKRSHLEGAKHCAIAFDILISHYLSNKKFWGRSPFHVRSSMSFNKPFRIHTMGVGSMFGDEATRKFDKEIAEFADNASTAIKEMQDSLKILSLGLNYKKFVRFNLLTPRAVRVYSGKYSVSDQNVPENFSYTDEEIEFLGEFIIESSLILQDFDFSTYDYINRIGKHGR